MRVNRVYTASLPVWDVIATVKVGDDGRYYVSVEFQGVDVPSPYHEVFDDLSLAVDWAKDQL